MPARSASRASTWRGRRCFTVRACWCCRRTAPRRCSASPRRLALRRPHGEARSPCRCASRPTTPCLCSSRRRSAATSTAPCRFGHRRGTSASPPQSCFFPPAAHRRRVQCACSPARRAAWPSLLSRPSSSSSRAASRCAPRNRSVRSLPCPALFLLLAQDKRAPDRVARAGHVRAPFLTRECFLVSVRVVVAA